MNSQAYAMRPVADDALERVRAALEQPDGATDLASLATIAGLSPTHLQRAFRRRYGVSPAEYARARRFGQLREALREGAAVTDAVYDAGFGSGSRVYEESDRRLGMTPASYRSGGAGASIRYTTTNTPLGQLREALREGAAVTDAVYEAGFGSGSRVYEESDRRLGMTP
ncbi:MAG TPA: helix-turn-helix domain-containing protein, partial [Luteibacter sp.]|nr:helix-turn-helix domain-containing protein [Luteibacter sp.]